MLTFTLTSETFTLDHKGEPSQKTTKVTSRVVTLPKWSRRAYAAAVRKAMGIKRGSGWKASNYAGDKCWRRGRVYKAAFCVKEEQSGKAKAKLAR